MKKQKMLILVLGTLAFIVTICEKKPTETEVTPTYVDPFYLGTEVENQHFYIDSNEQNYSLLSICTADNDLSPEEWFAPFI